MRKRTIRINNVTGQIVYDSEGRLGKSAKELGNEFADAMLENLRESAESKKVLNH
jgi:RNA 3'-terminal phosphate cyclase